jgi:hypothetical protein
MQFLTHIKTYKQAGEPHTGMVEPREPSIKEGLSGPETSCTEVAEA